MGTWELVALRLCGLVLLGRASPITTFATKQAQDAFLAIRDYEQQFGHTGLVPVTVVIGIESAGKSSWISARVGFPVSYAKLGVGTRCPVLYRLRHDTSRHEPHVLVNGKQVDKQSLRDVLKAHMDTLGNNFSDTTVNVGISSNMVQDMEIIDLPGLRPGATSGEEQQLLRITAKYMRQPNAHIVAVLKCTDSFATMPDKNYLHRVATDPALADVPPRPSWQMNTIFLINHFNKEALHWDMEHINAFFAEAASEKANYRKFFVVLKPDTTVDTAKDRIEKLEGFYANLAQEEKRWWTDFVLSKEKASGIAWDRAHDSMVGLERANAAVDVIWEDAFRRDVPVLLANARDKKAAQEQETERLQGTLTSMKGLPDLARNLVTDFHSHFKAIVDHTNVQDVDSAAHRMPHERFYSAQAYGHTYAEELRVNPVDKKLCPWLLTRDELVPMLGNSSPLREALDFKLIGRAAVDPATTVLIFTTLRSGFQKANAQLLANLARTNRPEGDIQTSAIVSQIAKSQVMRLKTSVEWFSKHLKSMFDSYTTPVLNVMLDRRSRYSVFRGSELEQDLRGHLSSLLDRQVQLVAEQYAYDAKRTSRFAALDPIGQSLMLTTLIQMDEVVAAFDHGVPPSVEPSGNRADILELEVQGEYLPLTSHRKQHKPSERQKRKHELLRNLAMATRQHQKTFNVEDFVSNGVVHLSLTDITMMDKDYINNIAYICYMHMVLHLMRDLRSTVELEFLDYISDSRDQKMLKDLLAINMTEVYLTQSLKITPDQVRAEFEKAKLEVASLQVIIHKLEGLRGCRPRGTEDTGEDEDGKDVDGGKQGEEERRKVEHGASRQGKGRAGKQREVSERVEEEPQLEETPDEEDW